jgi:regulator of cell morphogenesis and NO signaling
VVEDLKIAFPLFREDFIRHVYKEEDELFAFIRQMLVFLEDPRRYGAMLKSLKASSLHRMALHHAEDDDDMSGIRILTRDYAICVEAPLTLKLLYFALCRFESELAHHARVENELLFPKALELEYRVNRFIHRKSELN